MKYFGNLHNKIKVRFNLSFGKNFMKWKVTYPDGKAEYYEPSEVQLIMEDCFLRNQRGTAQKIYEGAEKSVCAWIECAKITITNKITEDGLGEQVSYNPRTIPHWICKGINADGTRLDSIISFERELFKEL